MKETKTNYAGKKHSSVEEDVFSLLSFLNASIRNPNYKGLCPLITPGKTKRQKHKKQKHKKQKHKKQISLGETFFLSQWKLIPLSPPKAKNIKSKNPPRKEKHFLGARGNSFPPCQPLSFSSLAFNGRTPHIPSLALDSLSLSSRGS